MTANMLNDIRNLRENIEEDYYISSFFSVEVQHHLQHLVEHRIKLILKQTVIFHAGESQNVETSFILDDRKTRTRLCLTLKSYERLPVTFESEGSINSRFKGRIKLKLTNYSCENIKMIAGSTVGYIVLQPFSLK
tara:strand:+ start:1257 stop:1661 length:405 start_codon:yes stop_codon:yes gene_type:complete